MFSINSLPLLTTIINSSSSSKTELFSLSEEISSEYKNSLNSDFGKENLEYFSDKLLIKVEDGETLLLSTLKKIIELDIKVKGTKVKTPTLDDVYLKYTGKRLEDE